MQGLSWECLPQRQLCSKEYSQTPQEPEPAGTRGWAKDCLQFSYYRSRIFASKYFAGLISRGFIFDAMTTQRNKLTLFIRKRKYFAGLTYIIEDDRWKFFHNENLPMYSISCKCTFFASLRSDTCINFPSLCLSLSLSSLPVYLPFPAM